MTKCGIFILTQNNPERKQYLKTSLYFLFRNFNKNYNYPIIILHEGDYDDVSKEEILKSIRQNHRHVIEFKEIEKEDFEVPQHIDMKKVERCIAMQPVAYWRNLKYRLMCNFWIKNFWKYCEDYDYVMRLDDDSIIEEPVKDDLFELMEMKGLVYMSNLVHVDCGLCNYGMKEFFENNFPELKERINQGLFINAKLEKTNPVYEKFKDLLLFLGKEVKGNSIDLPMVVMYYNNFFVTSTKFWKQDNVKEAIKKIDENGSVFYYRWGDSPIHSILATILEPNKISRAVFKYSKRLQREVFIDNDGNFHSFMPRSYDESSCITNKK